MKYLELDARHQECHELARALVGSPCALSRPAVMAGRIGFELVQPLQDVFLVCRGDENPKWESVTPHHVIFLPLDTLKLCPFVAMREGVSVACKSVPSLAKGVIESISTNRGFTDIVIGDYGAFDIREITLDLENLPKGARIVEVGE